MNYNVIITNEAKTHFEQIIKYLLYHIKNKQAAENVLADFESTIGRLTQIAPSLKFCENEKLRKAGYRTIHFKNHKYLLVYLVHENDVFVIGIYHASQDYESTLY